MYTNPLVAMSKRTSGGRFFQRNSNAQVPAGQMLSYSFEWHDDGLHTPHQNVPMMMTGSRQNSRAPTSGNEWTSYGWKNIARAFLGGQTPTREWNREDEMFFDPTHPREMSLGFSRADIEYAKLSERKNKEAFKSMDNRQKRLLSALENGQLFQLSRLELV